MCKKAIVFLFGKSYIRLTKNLQYEKENSLSLAGDVDLLCIVNRLILSKK